MDNPDYDLIHRLESWVESDDIRVRGFGIPTECTDKGGGGVGEGAIEIGTLSFDKRPRDPRVYKAQRPEFIIIATKNRPPNLTYFWCSIKNLTKCYAWSSMVTLGR